MKNMMRDLKIVYEDEDILVCHKMAGMATEGARAGKMDLISAARNHLACRMREDSMRRQGGKSFCGIRDESADFKRQNSDDSKGRQRNLPPCVASAENQGKSSSVDSAAKRRGSSVPYVVTVNRLDQPVEGVLVLAKNKKAATHLSEQIKNRTAGKYYYALCYRGPADESGVLEDDLIRIVDDNRAAVLHPDDREKAKKETAALDSNMKADKGKAPAPAGDGNVDVRAQEIKKRRAPSGDVKHAKLSYEVISRDGDKALLRIKLDTGRFHQIRVQLSDRGWPILGDEKYGSDESRQMSENLGIQNVCLVAYKTVITHPSSGKRMEFEITPDNEAIREALRDCSDIT